MTTCKIIIYICNLVFNNFNIIFLHVDRTMTVFLVLMHVNINKSHVNIIVLSVAIFYIAFRGQSYVIIVSYANVDEQTA